MGEIKEEIKLIKVTLTLNEKQYRGFNKWSVTIDNEKRIVTLQKVSFFLQGIEDIPTAFNLKEVDSYIIEYPKNN